MMIQMFGLKPAEIGACDFPKNGILRPRVIKSFAYEVVNELKAALALVREVILLFCNERCQRGSSPRPRKIQDKNLHYATRQRLSLARRCDVAKVKLKRCVHMPEHLVDRHCSPLPWGVRPQCG